jgi:hypothetical protein
MSMVKRKWIDWSVVGLSIFCIPLNIIQTRQRQDLVLPYEGMNKDKYWTIFLKDDIAHCNLFYSESESGFKFDSTLIFRNDFEHNTWGNDKNITSENANNGDYSAFVNEKLGYSPTFKITAGKLPKANPLFVYVKMNAYMTDFDNDASVVIAAIDAKSNQAYYYNGKLIKDYIWGPYKWQDVEFAFPLPVFRDTSDIVGIYVHSSKGSTVYFDDEEIKFGVRK